MQSPLASEIFTDVMNEDENEEKSLVLVIHHIIDKTPHD